VRTLGTLLLWLALPAAALGGQPSLVDPFLQRYTCPVAVCGDGQLHLVYQSKLEPQAKVLTCYRVLEPGKGWSAERKLHHDCRTVAYFNGALVVFRESSYTWYLSEVAKEPGDKPRGEAPEPGERTPAVAAWRTRQWPLPWRPDAACRAAGALWVFGGELKAGKRSIRAARFSPAKEPQRLDGPVAVEAALPVPKRADDIRAIARGQNIAVFWTQGLTTPGVREEPKNELWTASFDGTQWSMPPEQVPVPYPNCDYAVAEHGGEVWVLCKARGRRISAARPLRAVRLGRGSAPATVPGAEDALPDWTFGFTAASFEGTLYVFRACMTRLVAHRWREGAWLAAEPLSVMPAWPTYMLLWEGANVMLVLALLPVLAACAWRTRDGARRVALPDGDEVTAAAWSRRVAALLIDLLVAYFLSFAAFQLLARLYDVSETMRRLPLVMMVDTVVCFCYFAVSEVASGQTVGKRLLSIAVTGLDGGRASVGRIVVRNLLRPWPFLVPAAYVVGSIVLLLTPRRQRLGDLLAGTLVVEVPPPPPAPSSE